MMKKRTKNKIPGGFVALTFEVIDCKAFRELNGAALRTLILCLRKVRTFNPHDRFSFQFTLTFVEAKKAGLCSATFDRSMKQLHRLGFIDVVMRGGMRFQGKARTQYRLSQRYQQYGTPQFRKKHDGYCDEVHGQSSFHNSGNKSANTPQMAVFSTINNENATILGVFQAAFCRHNTFKTVD